MTTDPSHTDGAAGHDVSQPRAKSRSALSSKTLSRKLHWSEIVIVVALFLALLTFIAILRVPHIARQTQARRIRAILDCQGLLRAVDVFNADAGRYPTAGEGLNVLVSNAGSISGWHGPYVKMMPTDPWDRPYVYRAPKSPTTKPDVQSLGPDGAVSTDDIFANSTP